jgi:hypothetical protein
MLHQGFVNGLPGRGIGHFPGVQPHQVRKKVALAARFDGVADAGVRPIETVGLRIDELGRRFDGDAEAERDGARRRMETIGR